MPECHESFERGASVAPPNGGRAQPVYGADNWRALPVCRLDAAAASNLLHGLLRFIGIGDVVDPHRPRHGPARYLYDTLFRGGCGLISSGR
jgi:hypothetical protein